MRSTLIIRIIFAGSLLLSGGALANTQQLQVYKSPTCGCCVKWMAHLEDNGFTATEKHPANLSQLKAELGIAPRYQSCHTGVSQNGYVFEGHVPAKFINEFLTAPPAGAIGLSVPGMPLGSPGMEVEDRFMPYQILQLNSDGTTTVYSEITTGAQQF